MHRGQKFNEAPVRSCIRARISMRPHCAHGRGPGVITGPSAVTHWGKDLSEAPVRSRTTAMSSMRPQRANA